MPFFRREGGREGDNSILSPQTFFSLFFYFQSGSQFLLVMPMGMAMTMGDDKEEEEGVLAISACLLAGPEYL